MVDSVSMIRGESVFDEIRDTLPEFSFRCCFDVGANVGHSCQSFLSLGQETVVHAFEPQSKSFAVLSNRFRMNDRVFMVNCAVTNIQSESVFITNNMPSVDNFVSLTPKKGYEFSEIAAISGDKYCQRAGVSSIDYLKIDTEGHDLEVFLSFSSMIQSDCISFVEMELGMSRLNTKHKFLGDVLPVLNESGYEIFGIYEQIREFHNRPQLRRSNVVFLRRSLILPRYK